MTPFSETFEPEFKICKSLPLTILPPTFKLPFALEITALTPLSILEFTVIPPEPVFVISKYLALSIEPPTNAEEPVFEIIACEPLLITVPFISNLPAVLETYKSPWFSIRLVLLNFIPAEPLLTILKSLPFLIVPDWIYSEPLLVKIALLPLAIEPDTDKTPVPVFLTNKSFLLLITPETVKFLPELFTSV